LCFEKLLDFAAHASIVEFQPFLRCFTVSSNRQAFIDTSTYTLR
jgi:hypothetical protein